MMRDAVAATRFGRVRGEASADGAVLRFRGIPFARPPVGPLRWRPPAAPEPWSGIRPADSFSPACTQPAMPEEMVVFGEERVFSEDCLYLNVWTGDLDPESKRPVLVWIHHGGFSFGWGGAPMYDGAALARAGAVVVTFNYRLGRLGFLAHPLLTAESKHAASGNYGLMDQMAALAWVKENIANFGGDPDRVTIYGVSAGGYSGSVLMTSPLSAGLFDRAIAGSGGAFGPPADSAIGGDFLQTLDAAEATGAEIMAALGADDLDTMRRLSVETIVHARPVEMLGVPIGFFDGIYPILDGHVMISDALAAYEAGRHHPVPLITGSNADEAAVAPHNPDTEGYRADSAAVFGPFADRFLALFPAGPDGLTARSSQASHSDRLFSWQNWSFARAHAGQARTPVYYYRFAHAPPLPPGAPPIGAFHTAELPYVFRNLQVRDWPWREEDRALSDTISGYWLSFAATGNPNGGGRPHWAPFDDRTRTMMTFVDGAARPGPAPDSERMQLFDDFYRWARATGAVRRGGDAAAGRAGPSAASLVREGDA